MRSLQPLLLFILFTPWLGGAEFMEIEVVHVELKGCTFQHAHDWEMDTEADDYSEGRQFTVNSPYSSYVTIRLAELTREPHQILDDVLYRLDGPAITTLSRADFDKWGQLEGKGVHLRGKIMDMFPGGIRVFTAKPNNIAIIVTEFYFAEELQDTASGFTVVRETFLLNEN